MTDNVSLVNLALQSFGSRTTITAAQLAALSNNEAKQAMLAFANTRDSLLRMAPWDCGLKTANLTYITSVAGTPENTSPATNLWQPGQPRPPWAYEYQYPADCLRACWIIPAQQTGQNGVPITTAVTGGAPTNLAGGPIRFKIATDNFLMAAFAPTVVTPGTGYRVGEYIFTSLVASTAIITNRLGTFQPGQPQGAPIIYRVLTVDGAGGVVTVEPVNQVPDSVPARGGSYFYSYTSAGLLPTFTTNGTGTGATFTVIGLTISEVYTQRVILTNQEFATLCYVSQVTDPNVWDPLFQDAFYNALGANICMALTGDKALANGCIAAANASIIEARKADGNEGLTINDVTPDWIRTRGISWTDGMYSGPYSGFDWGGLLTGY